MGTNNLTYQDVVTIDLGALITAAKDWDDMAHTFDDLGGLYGAKVESIANDGSWTGVSSNVAYTRFTNTRKQFTDAHTEAHAIASLLRSAHDRFSQLIGHVKNLVEQAEKDEMTVNSVGEAVYDFRKLTPMRHDPDYPKYVTQVKDAEAAWTKKIKDAVRAVDDEDQVVGRALREAAGVGGFLERMLETLGQGQSFNGAAVGDLAAYEKEVKKEEAEQRAEAERKKKHDDTVKAICHGIVKGLAIFNGEPGPDLGSKFVGTLIDGVANATGYNNAQGITIGDSLGLGVGINGSISLVETRTPDGRNQLNLMYSGGSTTAGWEFGASANVGLVKSNAADISQLKGAGWDKSGSFHAGLGMWGSHQTAIGTNNSKGDPVDTVSAGVGLGLGNEVSTGFSNADGWTLWESGKGK